MLTSSYPRFPDDGAGSFVRSLARNVGLQGNQVQVLAPHDGSRVIPPEDPNVTVSFFSYAPVNKLRLIGYGRSLYGDVRLRPWAYLSVCCYTLAGIFAAVSTVRRGRCEVVHAHWVVPSGFLGTVVSRLLNIPLIVSLHGSDVYLAETNSVARFAARSALKSADVITACSQDLRDRAAALGAEASKVIVVPYGVDAGFFAPCSEKASQLRRQLAIGDEELVVFSVGRMVRKKGFEYLLQAAPQIIRSVGRPVRIVLGGDGDLRPELETLASKLGIDDRVIFTGMLTQGQVAACLSASDVVALPCVRDDWGNVDGLPNVLLEALAAGRPVVATSAGGIGMVLRDRENGRLVPERSSEALASAIVDLLERESLRASLGAAARATVEKHYSWTEIARRFEELYWRARSGQRLNGGPGNGSGAQQT